MQPFRNLDIWWDLKIQFRYSLTLFKGKLTLIFPLIFRLSLWFNELTGLGFLPRARRGGGVHNLISGTAGAGDEARFFNTSSKYFP